MLKNQGLQRELEDKQAVIDKQNSLHEELCSQKASMEQLLQELRAKEKKMELKYEDFTQEIHKANNIIEKVQKEKKVLKQKLKNKDASLEQQEKDIKQKESQLLDRERNTDSVRRDLLKTQDEVSNKEA